MTERILYCIPYPRFFSQHSGVGGHVAHASGIISAFTQLGFTVDVIAEENHAIFDTALGDIELLPAPTRGFIRRQAWYISLIKELRRKALQHQYRFCYIRYSASFAPYFPLLEKALQGLPLYIELNSLGSQWHNWFSPIDKLALRSGSKIVCVSDAVSRIVNSYGIPTSQTKVVYNGVDTNTFQPVEINEPSQHRRTRVAYAGLLKPEYGLESIIAAAKLLPPEDFEFHIYGDGPELRNLSGMANEQPNVTLHGPTPFSEMPNCLQRQDVLLYVTSEKYTYQSPTKLFEYMASEKPIVAASTPQTQTLLRHGEIGTLFKIGNILQLTQAIKKYRDNPKIAAEHAKASRKEAVIRHSWVARAKQILD